MRLRTRGDTRPASEPQIRRVFALARVAGLTGSDGHADREKVCELILHVAGIDEPDCLTREQVQDVYDELERLITENDLRAARNALLEHPWGRPGGRTAGGDPEGRCRLFERTEWAAGRAR